MTQLSTAQEALVEEAGRKWRAYKAEAVGVEIRIRKQIEADMEAAINSAKLALAESIRVALEAGATKIALRRATSKNPGTLEKFLALLDPPEGEFDAVTETGGLSIAWAGENLDITLDPAGVRETDADRSNPVAWTGLFEVFQREDGKVFIDPVNENNDAVGLIEWLRADRKNEEVVIAWLEANPK